MFKFSHLIGFLLGSCTAFLAEKWHAAALHLRRGARELENESCANNIQKHCFAFQNQDSEASP
jgi:hypothetical protein